MMQKGFLKLWRRWVIASARRMPIESAGVCMAFSVGFALTACYLLPKITQAASRAPMIAEALNGTPAGWWWMRRIEWTMIGAAVFASWLFHARCLQICFPKYYDPYRLD